MHELSLAQGIVDVAEEAARAQRFDRVVAIRLQVGALSHVDAGALAQGFLVASADTIASGARLEIEAVAGEGFCLACGDRFTAAARIEPCPRCGSHQWILTSGDELKVIDLEVQ